MRRPAPLPTPAPAAPVDEKRARSKVEPRDLADPAEAGERVGADAAHAGVDEFFGGPSTRARAGIPDAPSLSGRPAPLAPVTPRGTARGGDLPDEAAEPEIGARQVWAAARARRKALRAEVRRFTTRQRRRRMLWIGVVASLLLLVLGSVGAAYSPLFAVRQITVVGTSTLDPAVVETALAGQLGTPLAQVDSSAIKAALVQFPLVESYTLEARPPHELVVRILERTPIGSIASPAGYTLVDAAGVALATTPEAPAGHPVIDAAGGVGSPAFDAIGTVFRSLPADIRAQVTAMSATTANDVTLTLGGTGTAVVWGNADDSAEKARTLASAMAARPPADVYSYDVSSPEAVVIR